MDQGRCGGKRLAKTLMRVLLVASVVALSAAAVAQVPVPISAPVADSAEAVFRNLIWEPIVQAKCVNCHVAGGESGHTRLVFERGADAADHLQTFADFLEADEHDHEHTHLHGHELILVKIQGAGHGGGVQVPVGSEDFDNMDYFVALLERELAAEAEFHESISQPIVQAKCVNCHVEGGQSGHTRLVLVQSGDADDHEALNLQAFRNLVAAVEGEGGGCGVHPEQDSGGDTARRRRAGGGGVGRISRHGTFSRAA